MLLAIIIPILKRKKYGLTAVGVTLIMFGLSYYLMVFNITDKNMVTYALMNGIWHTVVSFAFSVGISMFSGVYAAVWRLRRDIIKQRKKSTGAVLGAGGALGGILAAGCPTCGAPLLALFGAPLALMSLPFAGLEIKALGLVLIGLSIYSLTEDVHKQLSGPSKISAPISKN